MTKKIVAIGGGENGRILDNGEKASYDTAAIDLEIVALTKKDKPNFLFIDHAMTSPQIEESYYQTMKKIYGEKLGCNCQDLKRKELDNFEIVQEKIAWADIIYEGGGDTKAMLDLWTSKGFDKILYEAYENGKVISGISAGAVCWFKACNSDDSVTGALESIDCLNWFNLYATPHVNEKGRKESTKEELKKNNMVGLLLSNGSALEIIDDKYRIIKSMRDAYALKCYWQKGIYHEERLDFFLDYQDLTNLIEK